MGRYLTPPQLQHHRHQQHYRGSSTPSSQSTTGDDSFKTRRAISAYLPMSGMITTSAPAELHILPRCEKRRESKMGPSKACIKIFIEADSEYVTKGVKKRLPQTGEELT